MKPSLVALRLTAVRMALSFAVLTGMSALQSGSVRTIPARTIPTPTTVSPEMQKAISQAWKGSASTVTLTNEQWKELARRTNENVEKSLPSMREQLHVTVGSKRMGGVRIYSAKPETIAEGNRQRLLVHVHGGAYVFYGGEAATTEAILMAHHGKIEVISVDYRMPPDFPFPAALDDSVAVWKEVMKSHTPRNVGLFGSSAGGGLTLATVIKLKELGLQDVTDELYGRRK